MNDIKDGFAKANIEYTTTDFDKFFRQFNISSTSKVKIPDLMNNIRIIAMNI